VHGSAACRKARVAGRRLRRRKEMARARARVRTWAPPGRRGAPARGKRHRQSQWRWDVRVRSLQKKKRGLNSKTGDHLSAAYVELANGDRARARRYTSVGSRTNTPCGTAMHRRYAALLSATAYRSVSLCVGWARFSALCFRVEHCLFANAGPPLIVRGRDH
jgi:hypothetical protein